MDKPSERLVNTLKANKFSITTTRLMVFKVLKNDGPISMNELCKKLINESDRASVYRTISIFEKLNIAQRVNIGWKYKLELSSEFQNHHHHLVCTKCGALIDFNELDLIETQIQNIATVYDFEITSHQIELQGLCKKCRKKT